MTYNILLLGASYGSLLASKLLFGGHSIHLVCLPEEANLINAEGFKVRLPVKGRKDPVLLDSRKLPGKVTAGPAEGVDPKQYDLVGLCMQEPQYRSPGVRELLDAIARSRVPCMSIMNMPPLPYLARIAGLDPSGLAGAYLEPALWEGFEPGLMTLCSPDPQAFRPPEEPPNVLQVGLPTNFKVAQFADAAHNTMLAQLDADISAARWTVEGEPLDIPVKLKLHSSLFVPLAKWAMLLTGNYRCVLDDAVQPIQQAVHADLAQSRAVYAWVSDLCCALGASPDDMVAFDKYAAAATGLLKPSSAARALAAGAQHVERIDALIKLVAAQKGQQSDSVDATVARVDAWLARNRQAAASRAH